jgi:methyl-accepting chemotaxis protein
MVWMGVAIFLRSAGSGSMRDCREDDGAPIESGEPVKTTSIRHLLFATFALVLILIGAVGLTGWRGIRSMEADSKRLSDGSVASTVRLGNAQNAMWELRFGVANFMTGDDALRAEILGAETGWRNMIDTNIDAYASGARTADERRLLAEFEDVFGRYMASRPRWFELFSAGKLAEAAQWRTVETNAQARTAVATLTTLIDTQQKVGVAKRGMLADSRRGAELRLLALAGAALLLVLGAAGYLLSRIRRPLRRTVDMLNVVADGDLSVRLTATHDDEIGQVATAINRSLDRIGQAMDSFGTSAGKLRGSAQALGSVSRSLRSGADRTSGEAEAVARSAEDVSRHIEAVAAGAEQMGASIRDIAGNAADAAGVASRAVQTAQVANTTVAKLGDSSAEIGNVLKVITSIAEQTNLLALNATIEAARAGEAGRGFAVVAAEVKDLAQETAKATEDIRQRIEAIQGDTAGAVDAIVEIAAVIGRINDYQGTIASAVEEQTATTAEMRRLADEAARGAGEIRSSIGSVGEAAADAKGSVNNAEDAAGELAGMSAELERLVGQFRY